VASAELRDRRTSDRSLARNTNDREMGPRNECGDPDAVAGPKPAQTRPN
jgi:hypothetical protein